jgi:hypothetical protein
MSGVFLLSTAPAVVWYGYVQVTTTGDPLIKSPILVPAILRALGTPVSYPPGTPFVDAVCAADYLALAGVLLAFGLAFFWFARKRSDPLRITAMLFATLALTLQGADHWRSVYAFGRVYTPVLLCLAATAAQVRNPWLLAPVAMMLPRIAMELAPQALGILRWFA